MASPQRDSRFAVLGVGPHLVGVDAADVQDLFVLGTTHRAGAVATGARGVTLVRGRLLPVVDVRVRFGLPTSAAELDALVRLLDAREQDHRAWLAELEASVREQRPFGLATDPRRCKFGQWYYGFRSDDAVVRGELAKFEEPHARIHALADVVAARAADGRLDEALALVERARRGVLAELIELFERTRAVLREQHREIGVAVRTAAGAVVLAVDSAEAVTDLDAIPGDADPVRARTVPLRGVSALARWRERKDPVLLLDVAGLSSLAT